MMAEAERRKSFRPEAWGARIKFPRRTSDSAGHPGRKTRAITILRAWPSGTITRNGVDGRAAANRSGGLKGRIWLRKKPLPPGVTSGEGHIEQRLLCRLDQQTVRDRIGIWQAKPEDAKPSEPSSPPEPDNQRGPYPEQRPLRLLRCADKQRQSIASHQSTSVVIFRPSSLS